MITPATASTGTTALMPRSGVSAALRMTPVPKPPIPPTIAAARPSAATAASVGASRSNLAARHRARAAGGIYRDVGQGRLGHLDDRGIRRPALREHLHLHGHRGVADAQEVGVERKHV